MSLVEVCFSRSFCSFFLAKRVRQVCFLGSQHPLLLLLFPEGTDLSDENLARSHKHSEEKGLPKYHQAGRVLYGYLPFPFFPECFFPRETPGFEKNDG